MFDAVSPSDGLSLQRSVGALRVSFRRRGEHTVLEGLYQFGCLKARFPRVDPGEWPVSVILNTSGGVAGGDRLDASFRLDPETRATITSQAAERYYRLISGGTASIVRNRLTLEAGATAEWLPQETILYDRCGLDRRLDIDIAADASLLGVEMLVFGRTAMGEQVSTGSLRDVIHIRRGGAAVWHDAIRMDGPIAERLSRPAIGNGPRAVATLFWFNTDAETMIEPVRAVLSGDSGASAWNGMLIARILMADGAALRQAVLKVLAVLRHGRAMPRVWSC